MVIVYDERILVFEDYTSSSFDINYRKVLFFQENPNFLLVRTKTANALTLCLGCERARDQNTLICSEHVYHPLDPRSFWIVRKGCSLVHRVLSSGTQGLLKELGHVKVQQNPSSSKMTYAL